MAKVIFALALLPLMASCSSEVEKSARQAMATEIPNVKEARYRSLRKLSDRICGEVSVKDEIGDYSTYKKFAVLTDGSVFFQGKFDSKVEKVFMGDCLE